MAKKRINPGHARVVRLDELRWCAKQAGVTIRREGMGSWYYLDDEGNWQELGRTNFLAYEALQGYFEDKQQ